MLSTTRCPIPSLSSCSLACAASSCIMRAWYILISLYTIRSLTCHAFNPSSCFTAVLLYCRPDRRRKRDGQKSFIRFVKTVLVQLLAPPRCEPRCVENSTCAVNLYSLVSQPVPECASKRELNNCSRKMDWNLTLGLESNSWGALVVLAVVHTGAHRQLFAVLPSGWQRRYQQYTSYSARTGPLTTALV